MCGLLSVVDPARNGKVSRLGTVEAVIVASMVAVRECDYEFACLLGGLEIKRKEKKSSSIKPLKSQSILFKLEIQKLSLKKGTEMNSTMSIQT